MTMRGFCEEYDKNIREGYTAAKSYELTEAEFQRFHNTRTTKFSSYESFKVCRSEHFKKHGRF